VVLAAFVLATSYRNARARSLRRQTNAVHQDTTIMAAGKVQGSVRYELVPRGKGQTTPPEELRRRVQNLAPGTYVNDILAEQDSALYRWPERVSNALRVYVEPTSAVSDWSAAYPQMARDVFAEWSEAGFPLTFTFIYDSASADITIRWIDRFGADEGQRIGVTRRIQTSQFLIARADVDVGTHDSTGRALSARLVDGVLRHEIGHALGLNHANDPKSVMYRESATSTISAVDRATLRLLYLVPAGSLK
jgi:predicted Zn-dependent protease